MDHDYTLLRPFDEEAAKRGEPIMSYQGQELWDYVAGPDSSGRLCLRIKSRGTFADLAASPVSLFRMKPICWVEGKPVYKDDHLYHTTLNVLGSLTVVEGCLLFEHKGIAVEAREGNLTWTEPVEETWINIYPGSMCGSDQHNAFCSHGYPRKELADQAARRYNEPPLMCIKVEIKKETK